MFPCMEIRVVVLKAPVSNFLTLFVAHQSRESGNHSVLPKTKDPTCSEGETVTDARSFLSAAFSVSFKPVQCSVCCNTTFYVFLLTFRLASTFF